MLRQGRSDSDNRAALLIGGGVLAAVGVGSAAALAPPLVVAAGLLGCLLVLWLARSINGLVLAVVGAATLLPFGTLPFKVGITPTLLELALLGLYGMLIIRGLVQADQPLRWSFMTPSVLLLVALSVFSFLIGSAGHPDSLTAHNYFKFLLSVGLMWGIINAIHTEEQARWLLRVLISAGAVAALIGIALWVAPDSLALRMLVSLAPIGYPNSGRVLRYVEDNPFGVERAIGTSVDPNAFGGLVALLGALALAQALAARPVLPRKWAWAATGLMALAVFLTQSRAALGGFVLATLFLAIVRYRRLWRVLIGVGVLGLIAIVVLGKGGAFIERVVEGVQFRDQANQMRLAEFRNALAIIREYPWFGVGFGSAPSIDLTTGVSSIYLTIASRMGLSGLAVFVLCCAAFFGLTTAAIRRGSRDQSDALLAIQAAIIAALAIGLLDHYFFNIEFAHMVALFWLTIGLGMVFYRVAGQHSRSPQPPAA